MIALGKYSIGTGDRFALQGKAQLSAVKQAREKDRLDISIVWNKSHREHAIIHTLPDSVRREADSAVAALKWDGAYFVDADHINLSNVDLFIDASDFFTIDVADFTGRKARAEQIDDFVKDHQGVCGRLSVPGIPEPMSITEEDVRSATETYLSAVKEAGRIYRYIESKKGRENFVTEVSMDEAEAPQSPEELLVILAAIAGEKIPLQTIAPKFTGRFNKGVDFVGDVDRFGREFEAHVCIVRHAVRQFGLPPGLKLSVHSGSDKFSIYPAINRAIKKHGAGLHIKTAGTTWLEELVGLALSGEEGLAIAKEVCSRSLERIDELCGPYIAVIDIDSARLPDMQEVSGWSGRQFAQALKHDLACPAYNPDLRQLLHVGYKIAAEMGSRFAEAVKKHENSIAALVTQNLYERHIRPVFL